MHAWERRERHTKPGGNTPLGTPRRRRKSNFKINFKYCTNVGAGVTQSV
jgi:hypothetical protein